MNESDNTPKCSDNSCDERAAMIVIRAHDRMAVYDRPYCEGHANEIVCDLVEQEALSLSQSLPVDAPSVDRVYDIELISCQWGTDNSQLWLREKGGDGRLGLVLHYLDAWSVVSLLRGVSEPLSTYQVALDAIGTLGGRLQEVAITDYDKWHRRHTTELRFMTSDRRFQTECAPGDAVIFALIADAPILVANSVLQKRG